MIDMLGEVTDSSEDSDYIVGESSDDSLEYETDEEVSLETISETNLVEIKRMSKPCEVEIWKLDEESTESDEDTDDTEETLKRLMIWTILQASLVLTVLRMSRMETSVLRQYLQIMSWILEGSLFHLKLIFGSQ